MPITITIEAFGEVEMERTLLRWDERIRNPRRVWTAIHKEFLALEEHQFESQGELSGGWKPLADSTVRAKERAGLDPRIMFATERLYKSLTHQGSEDMVYEATADQLLMGSTVPYGVYHQSRQPRQRLPRRPVVVLPDQTKVAWVKKLQRWIVSGQL